MSKGLRSVASGAVDPELLRALYNSGLTQRECAAEFGVGHFEIHNIMVAYDIPRRPCVKRDQRGEKNAGWKGSNASYNSMHRRVIDVKGRADHCDECGAREDGKRYDWANLTGRYEDIDDYRMMCRSCHQKYDGARRREAGAKRHRGRNARSRMDTACPASSAPPPTPPPAPERMQ